MRVLLVSHHDLARSPNRTEASFVRALEGLADVDLVFWEDLRSPTADEAIRATGRAPADADYDALVLFVRFRRLHHAPDFGWTGFGGLRVWIEHDAWNAFSPAHSEWHGTYQDAFRRHRFDLMVSTGKVTTTRLIDDGVNAAWVPKGFTPEVFHDLGLPRDGVCTFGTRWPARRAMLDRISRSGLVVEDVSGPFETLNARLNAHASAIVCNMPATTPFGKVGRGLRRFRPGFVELHPAVEPMIKTFEVAGAGCAPIVDTVEDLDDLGFVHGRTCFVYSTFADLIELLRSTSPDVCTTIGGAAATLARSRHTWPHRAAEFVAVLEGELSS